MYVGVHNKKAKRAKNSEIHECFRPDTNEFDKEIMKPISLLLELISTFRGSYMEASKLR